MKKVLVLLAFTGLLFILKPSLMAQNQEAVAGRLFYTELGGPGVLMSVNWDSRFQPDTRLGFGYRAGIGFSIGEFEGKRYEDPYGGYYYHETVTKTYYTIPVGINYIFGKPNTASSFEVGAGTTFLTRKISLFTYDNEQQGHFIGHFVFMYRIIPVNGGFSFRVGFTPMIGTAGDIFPMGALSFGYVF
jgi:hypothetical protein